MISLQDVVLHFLDFPGDVETLRKSMRKAEDGRRRPEKVHLHEGRRDIP